jgi:DNA-binding ferritin-like protein
MDILADFRISTQHGDNELREKTFLFLIKLMAYRNQLRMNHWQTTSYAEHKWTDKFMGDLTEFIDTIGEYALGALGRPQINTTSTNISDINIVGSKAVLDAIEEDVQEMLAEYKITEFEGMVAVLGELDSSVKKFKFLSTLE